MPLCMMWSLWRERNARVFEREEGSAVQIKKSCLFTLYEWAKAHSLVSCDILPDFVDMLSFREQQLVVLGGCFSL